MKKGHFRNSTIHILGTLLSLFLAYILTSSALAQVTAKYTPLVGVPGLTNTANASLPDYLNRIYFLTITIGALVGVIKIAFAGVKYSLSDVVTSKEQAKSDIKGVLLGLLILVAPAVVLGTINPQLLNLDVLKLAPKVDLSSSSSGGVTAKSTPTYQVDDLNTVGKQIEAASNAASTGGRVTAQPQTTGSNTGSSQTSTDSSKNVAANTSGNGQVETLIPIQSGTVEEMENIRAQCMVNMHGASYNFFKDPARKSYVCRNY